AGYPLTVWNRNRERTTPWLREGASPASSPREATAAADIIIGMLADDNASRSVWLGPEGVLAGAKPGAILIESSTLTPGWVRELAQAAAEHRCALLDAPVTGSKVQAANGELLFLVGGDRAAFDAAFPVFKAMGRDAVYLGATGSGALMKLV